MSFGETWKGFIDPKHWDLARSKYPKQPWRLYIQPIGEYPIGTWGYFQKASDWIKTRQRSVPYPFMPYKVLTLETLTSINSLLKFGVIKPWQEVVRNNHPKWVTRPNRLIRGVFDRKCPIYQNDDELKINVLGFVPWGPSHLDFHVLKKTLSRLSIKEKGKILQDTFLRSKVPLYPKVDSREEYWATVFPYRQSEILENLESILKWAWSQCDIIMSQYVPGTRVYNRAVLEFSVKMQRYVDITHFCDDGSGRTSKLMQTYICQLFGVPPPKPVVFRYKNCWMENGTYLPQKVAIKMALRGSRKNL